MKRTLTHALVVTALVALLPELGAYSAAASPDRASRTADGAVAVSAPFKGQLEGRHVSRTPRGPGIVFDRFEAEGQATHLGRFRLVIESTVNFGSLPVTGTGTYTFTAANGDRLVADQRGSSSLVRPGLVLITEHASIDPVRSTGRFAGAEGTFTVERLADAATGVGGVTVGTVEGTISLLPGAGDENRTRTVSLGS